MSGHIIQGPAWELWSEKKHESKAVSVISSPLQNLLQKFLQK